MSKGFKLLTPGNPKTAKGEGLGYLTFILHLAPAKLSGFEVCPMATQGCRAACLNTAGRGGMMKGVSRLTYDDLQAGTLNTIQKASIRRTRMFFEQRNAFMAALVTDIMRAVRMAAREGLIPVFRLNGTSDIRWESVSCSVMGRPYRSIMHAFPALQFYDYTKLPNRKGIPTNYALTFSLADGNDAAAAQAARNGMNVAAVFRTKADVARAVAGGFLLDCWRPVVNGDAHDLRFLDPAGHVVALYAKGNARRDQSGFVREYR